MKEVRDSRYHGRISSIDKARWEAASKQHGYRSLSLFIEEAVEEKIAGGAHESTATPSSSPVIEFITTNVTDEVPSLSRSLTVGINKQYGTDFKKTPDKKKRW